MSYWFDPDNCTAALSRGCSVLGRYPVDELAEDRRLLVLLNS